MRSFNFHLSKNNSKLILIIIKIYYRKNIRDCKEISNARILSNDFYIKFIYKFIINLYINFYTFNIF